jgi:Outer membrane lipoprotein LolB
MCPCPTSTCSRRYARPEALPKRVTRIIGHRPTGHSALNAAVRMSLSSCAWLASALLAVGCLPFGAAAPASQFPTADQALASLTAQHECSRALRGEAKLDTFDEHGRLRVGALFMLQHPQSLRLDLLSPLGGTLATLTSDGERFALLSVKDKAFHIGSASQCNVERFLQVPVPPPALAQLMAGEAPVLVHEPGQARIAWQGEGYRIEIDSLHGAHEVIELQPHAADFSKPYAQQRLRVTRVLVEQQGVTLYEAELSEFAARPTAKPRIDPLGIDAPVPLSGPACNAEVPARIRFLIPLSERDVIFEASSVEHNPPLIEGVFRQQPPAGVSLKPSPCP